MDRSVISRAGKDVGLADNYGSSAAEGDALVTGSTNYTVRDVIDDGTGMTTLMLEAD